LTSGEGVSAFFTAVDRNMSPENPEPGKFIGIAERHGLHFPRPPRKLQDPRFRAPCTLLTGACVGLSPRVLLGWKEPQTSREDIDEPHLPGLQRKLRDSTFRVDGPALADRGEADVMAPAADGPCAPRVVPARPGAPPRLAPAAQSPERGRAAPPAGSPPTP